MMCQKCGMKLKKINYRHKEFCDNVPPPQALAREYLDSGKTYEELATDYDVSLNGLRMRVLFGLALLGEPAHPTGRRAGPPAPNPEPHSGTEGAGASCLRGPANHRHASTSSPSRDYEIFGMFSLG